LGVRARKRITGAAKEGERPAPKHHDADVCGAFGLLVTLVWLYLEMLRLLAKLQERR
jgi:uncharacterized YccA/Bax inhibitor family protein